MLSTFDRTTTAQSGPAPSLAKSDNTVREGGVKFSQERAERDQRSVERALSATPEELRTHATADKAKADPNVPDAVKQAMTGLYAAYSDEAALRDAQAWMDRDGAVSVEATIKGKTALDKRDVAAGKLLLARHSATGSNTQYAELLRAIIERTNTQAQALQAMHLLFDTTTPEGALAFVQKEVAKATAALSKENQEQAKLIDALLKKIEQFRGVRGQARKKNTRREY